MNESEINTDIFYHTDESILDNETEMETETEGLLGIVAAATGAHLLAPPHLL